jgi:hypothetical protein
MLEDVFKATFLLIQASYSNLACMSYELAKL